MACLIKSLGNSKYEIIIIYFKTDYSVHIRHLVCLTDYTYLFFLPEQLKIMTLDILYNFS